MTSISPTNFKHNPTTNEPLVDGVKEKFQLACSTLLLVGFIVRASNVKSFHPKANQHIKYARWSTILPSLEIVTPLFNLGDDFECS